MKVVALKDKQLSEAKATAAKAIKIAESKEVEKQTLIESAKRKDTLNDLLAPLSKDQREIMTDLLESVQTVKLKSAFEKYIPAVIDGRTPAKQKAVLSEAKEITGNRDTVIAHQKDRDENVFELRRLAGLK
jgi:hypothetical protein